MIGKNRVLTTLTYGPAELTKKSIPLAETLKNN
jgi:hypothetical protein